MFAVCAGFRARVGPFGVFAALAVVGCQPQGDPNVASTEQETPSNPQPGPAFSVNADAVDGDGYAPVLRSTLVDLYENSWFEGRSGQGFLHLAPGHYIIEDGGSDRWKVAHHLSAYDRESHVPLWVYSPGDPTHETRPGTVGLEAVGATMVHWLGIERPPWVQAKPLAIVAPDTLRAVVVLVLDALPHRLLEEALGELPHFKELHDRSKVYSDAWLGYMSSATTVSHAVIGTGAPPRATGIPLNHDPVTPGTKREIFRDGNLSPLVIPTVADLHDARHQGRAHVISFSSQSRAAIAMAGHGAGMDGGDHDIVAWQANHTGSLATWPKYFSLPEGARNHDPAPFMDRRGMTGEEWTPDRLFYSPATVLYCEEAVNRLLDAVPFGADAICDLLYFNQKVLDNLGHLAGPRSTLYAEGLQALDGFIGRFVEGLHRTLGKDFLLILTSDHGFGPGQDPGHNRLHRRADVQDRINAAFPSPQGEVVLNIRDLNLFFDPVALRAGGHDIETVCGWIEREIPWVVSALPLSEIQPPVPRPN